MALSGYKEFATGEVLTASDVNAYLMQAVMVFADSSARDSGIPSAKREEGMFYFLKDTNELGFFDGSSFVAYLDAGDITAVNTSATSGLSGGASSGAVNLTVNPTQLTDGTGITVDNSNDLLIIYDNDTTTTKKINPSQLSTGGGASAGLILTLG